jgi:hypothetical protein
VHVIWILYKYELGKEPIEFEPIGLYHPESYISFTMKFQLLILPLASFAHSTETKNGVGSNNGEDLGSNGEHSHTKKPKTKKTTMPMSMTATTYTFPSMPTATGVPRSSAINNQNAALLSAGIFALWVL